MLSRRRPDLDNGVYAYAQALSGECVGVNSAWGYWVGAWIGNVGFLVPAFGAPGMLFPAFHNLDTEVARQVHERHGLTEMEVSDEVFECEASIVFTQAENRLHTVKAVLAATLA